MVSTGAEEARVVKEIEQLLAHKTELITPERGPASGWERAEGACEARTVGSHRGRRRLQYRQTEAWLLETEEERELHVVQQALCLVCVYVNTYAQMRAPVFRFRVQSACAQAKQIRNYVGALVRALHPATKTTKRYQSEDHTAACHTSQRWRQRTEPFSIRDAKLSHKLLISRRRCALLTATQVHRLVLSSYWPSDLCVTSRRTPVVPVQECQPSPLPSPARLAVTAQRERQDLNVSLGQCVQARYLLHVIIAH